MARPSSKQSKQTPAPRTQKAGVAAKLAPYNKKRDFKRTPEPDGQGEQAKNRDDSLHFVVQKHAARALHYDFRLELAGVLLSWSVPKGPSLKPGERRLAVRTEDHPLGYASFEGVIPAGEYGGGTVIVWDRGAWRPEGDAAEGMASGRLTFELEGEKLRGRFHLVKTRTGPKEKPEQWLLFKGKGEGANDTFDITNDQTESVISGRTLEQVKEDPERVWHSNKASKKKQPDPALAAPKKKKATKSKTSEPKLDTIALVKQLPVPFAFTNLEKQLYPAVQLRKADVVAYYASVAELMLPHISKRPLTLVRCPNGAGNKCFFQKHANDSTPDVVQRITIAESDGSGEYMTVKDMKGLLALAQLGVLEIHTWGCHSPKVEKPDKLVFDIDPDVGLAWDAVVEAAVELRQRLTDVGLTSFVQTTGGKGLHVVAPLKPALSWDEHKQVALAFAQAMVDDNPKRYLVNQRKDLRKGRIFLDYLRNGRGATAVAPYSTRSRAEATVAAPITWDELMEGAQPSDFTLRSMIERTTASNGRDPWAGYNKLEQGLSRAALRGLL